MRIVTINTWKGEGRYQRRLALLAGGLASLSPDIVCLQEVLQTRDGELDTADHLARGLSLVRYWAPARLKMRSIEGRPRPCYAGLAILVRPPILGHHRMTLPSHREDPERRAHWIDITAGGERWRVVNTHLTHLEGAGDLRQRQISALLEEIQGREMPDVVWLCGDFNAAPHDPELQVLMNRSDWTVRDAFIEGGGRAHRATFPVAASEGGGRRIDHILMAVRPGRPRPVCRNAGIVLHHPDRQGLFPSDHAGLSVSVSITGTEGT